MEQAALLMYPRAASKEEEVAELAAAIKQNDIVEIADALADIQYVLAGAVHEFGLGSSFANLFDEVQRSNMSKACADTKASNGSRWPR